MHCVQYKFITIFCNSVCVYPCVRECRGVYMCHYMHVKVREQPQMLVLSFCLV